MNFESKYLDMKIFTGNLKKKYKFSGGNQSERAPTTPDYFCSLNTKKKSWTRSIRNSKILIRYNYY